MKNSKHIENQRNTLTRKFNDLLFSILFLGCFLVVIALAVLYGKDVMSDATTNEQLHQEGQNLVQKYAKYKYVFHITASIAGGAAVLSALWTIIMICCGVCLIWMGIVVVIVGNVAFGILGTKVLYDRDSSNFWWPAVVGFSIAILVAAYTICIRNRIHFASANLKVATAAITHYPLTLVIAIMFLLLQVAWCLVCCIATYAALHHDDYKDDPENSYNAGQQFGIVAGMLLIFYWGAYIIQNIVAVTVSGTVSSWWLQGNSPMNTTKSLCRALTFSFGSICFGSLFVAILDLIKTSISVMIQGAKKSGNAVAVALLTCLQCCFNCFQRIVQYFNKFAYAYIGIYGFSFLKSGKMVFELFQSKGWSAIANDSLVESVLMLGSLTVGCGCAAIGFTTVTYGNPEWFQGVEHPRAVLGISGLLTGFVICHVMMSVISGAVATVFILFAEESAALQKTHPRLFQTLDVAWKRVYPGEYGEKSQEMTESSV